MKKWGKKPRMSAKNVKEVVFYGYTHVLKKL